MISIEEIASERGLDEEDVCEMLDLFLEYTQTEELVALGAALNNRAYADAAKRAHSIKGAALNLKLDQIASFAQQIEKKCAASSSDNLESLFEELTRQVNAVAVFRAQMPR